MGGIFRTTREFVVDRCQNAIEILQDIIVPEAKHPIALLLKILAPDNVSLGVWRKHVLASVNLDNDPCIVAGEIREERADRSLPAEVRVWKRPPESGP